MKISLDICIVLFAIVLQVLSIVTWFTLAGKVPRWIWWTILAGFLSAIAHPLNTTFHLVQVNHFSQFSGLAIAIISLFAALASHFWIAAQERRNRKLLQISNKLVALQRDVQSREPIATKVAEIIGDLRSQIIFYEAQAKEHDLPLFQNGGTDRTRTG